MLREDFLAPLALSVAALSVAFGVPSHAEMRHLVETYESSQSTGNQNFATLLDFSLGRVNDLTALVHTRSSGPSWQTIRCAARGKTRSRTTLRLQQRPVLQGQAFDAAELRRVVRH